MKNLGYVGWGGWVGWLGLACFGLALSLTLLHLLHILWKQAEGDGDIFYILHGLGTNAALNGKIGTVCYELPNRRVRVRTPRLWATWRSRRWKAGSSTWDSTMSTGACQWSHTSGSRHMRDLYDFVSTLRGSTCGRQCAALEQCRRGQLQGSNWALPGPSWWRSMSRSWQK